MEKEGDETSSNSEISEVKQRKDNSFKDKEETEMVLKDSDISYNSDLSKQIQPPKVNI